MTRPQIDTNIFNQLASSGKAGLPADPANGFVTQVIANLNNISTDLDTASIPATTGVLETVTSGALSATLPLHYLSVTGTQAYTQPDGTTIGQRSIVECTVAGSTPLGTLTITTPLSGEPATYVFNTVGQRLELIWRTGGWHVERKTRAGDLAVVVGTTVLTGFSLNNSYKLTVTGTVHSTTTKGIPNGSVGGEVIHISCGTASGSPVGDIAITAQVKTTMAAATSLANLTDTTMSLTCVWNGAAWQAIEFTAGTGTSTLS